MCPALEIPVSLVVSVASWLRSIQSPLDHGEGLQGMR